MITTQPVESLAFLLQVIVIILGGFLSLQAYRGYDRHGVAQMKYLASGIFFLTVIPSVMAIGLPFIPILADSHILLLTAVVYLLGLGFVDYALNHLSD